MINKVKDLLSVLTDEEKAMLLGGTNFSDTVALENRGIPKISMVDGPHGLRRQSQKKDMLGVNKSEKATCFPPAATMASSWDEELVARVGEAIAEECLQEDVQVLLGPGVNIKRNPLCGRNFEYYSEDPLLSGAIGTAFVNGVQSKGIGASLKHFAVNNTEDQRLFIDEVVDERALREIYLRPFELVVKNAGPKTVMESYNKINGVWASENRRLLIDILREEWGFTGTVISDWGATRDRVDCLKAGLDMEMPGDVAECRKRILGALGSGELTRQELDAAVTRVLELIQYGDENRIKGYTYDKQAHHALARTVAESGAVLMKNNGALPVSAAEKLCIIGSLAKNMRYQGAGSSLINPNKLDNPLDEMKKLGDYPYAAGYRTLDGKDDELLTAEAIETATASDKILLFMGLTPWFECEGFDREDMKLPRNQLLLLDKLCELGKPVVVILFGGSPVELPFIHKVSAVLNMYLPGQAGGSACANLLFGRANPSGKLAETYPLRYEDSPSAPYSPKGPVVAEHRESIYVGYRYFEKVKLPVAFPFGFGLSYTSFAYSEATMSQSNGKITVEVPITNTGLRSGQEIVQLYAGKTQGDVFREVKKLVAFKKLLIKAGETKTATLQFDISDLAYYNTAVKRWIVEDGDYTIYTGASSVDIRQEQTLRVRDETQAPCPYSRDRLAWYYAPGADKSVSDTEYQALIGHPLTPNTAPAARPYSVDSRLADFNQSALGKIILNLIVGSMKSGYRKAQRLPDEYPDKEQKLMSSYFLVRLMPQQSLLSLSMSSSGTLSLNMAYGLSELANGHLFKAIRYFIKKL